MDGGGMHVVVGQRANLKALEEPASFCATALCAAKRNMTECKEEGKVGK